MKQLLFAALIAGLLSSQGSAQQSTRESVEGVWRVVEAAITGPGARTIAFAERPNLTIITARHYSRVEVQADGPRPILADVAKASADELRAVWGPFVGEAGTYEVTPGESHHDAADRREEPRGHGSRSVHHLLVQTGWRHAVIDSTAKPEWPVRQSVHTQVGAGRMTPIRGESSRSNLLCLLTSQGTSRGFCLHDRNALRGSIYFVGARHAAAAFVVRSQGHRAHRAAERISTRSCSHIGGASGCHAEPAGPVRNPGGRCAAGREDHEGGTCRGRRVRRASAAAGAAAVGRLHDAAGVLPRGRDRVANGGLGDQVRSVDARRGVERQVRRGGERRFRRHDLSTSRWPNRCAEAMRWPAPTPATKVARPTPASRSDIPRSSLTSPGAPCTR